MRKFLKDNILEIFKTMYEAHSSIKKLVDSKDFDSVNVILEDCQNAAIQIGTSIESCEGEGFITVKLLEEYCETVYEVSQSLSDGYAGNKAQKALDKKLIKAENSAKNDIKVKLEIVFMPYKSSMWDSLESVWKAADEDPDCDAYVVPIPYYDRNPDHSFGEFHYEGGDYPDYVPVVHYEAYNLEQRRPDVIYIHYPYDDCNYVTSTDPRFYSKELKKYTDKLVYIPYFVLGEPAPDNEQTVEKISHFVTVPGVINADKVIVQSEAMRQVYIKVLLNRFGDTPNNRKFVEDKIEGTGSPKFDKVLIINKSTFSLPEQWKHLIKGKKVVLLNNSIPQILNNKDIFLDKLEKTLDIFEKREDYVLWWRPHPLIKQTISSMCPSLYERYSVIVNKYRKKAFGIYDDTADLYRAIFYSDRYYGAKSSVIWLYALTGKPLLIFSKATQKRDSFEINNWFTSDIEATDLTDWLDGKEKWKLLKSYNVSGLNSDVGNLIHYTCKQEVLL